MDRYTKRYLRRSNAFAKRKLGEDADEVIIKTKSGNVLTLKAGDLPKQDRQSALNYVFRLLPDADAKDGMPLEKVAEKGGYTSKTSKIHVRRLLRRLEIEKKVVQDDVGFKKSK